MPRLCVCRVCEGAPSLLYRNEIRGLWPGRHGREKRGDVTLTVEVVDQLERNNAKTSETLEFFISTCSLLYLTVSFTYDTSFPNIFTEKWKAFWKRRNQGV